MAALGLRKSIVAITNSGKTSLLYLQFVWRTTSLLTTLSVRSSSQ